MSKATLTTESAALVSRQMGHSVEEMQAARAFELEGKPLFEIFRGRSDMSGEDFPDGPADGRDGAKPFPGKRASSPFKSSDDDFDAADRPSPKLKRTPTTGPGPGKRLLTPDQKKIALALGVDEDSLAERLDTLTDDEEDVLGVDGLPRKTRVKAPSSRLVRDLVAA